MITFRVRDQHDTLQTIEVPEGINLSLMEVLKGSDYPILATCGGMALCATCHVTVQHGGEHLFHASETEMEMLDTLPDATSESRLACQIRIDSSLEGAVFALKAVSN